MTVNVGLDFIGIKLDIDWSRLDARKKVEIIEAMGFRPVNRAHEDDCLAGVNSWERCFCVPPPTHWYPPEDVLRVRDETAAQRRR